MNWVRAGASNSLQYLIWLKSKIVKIYSIVQSVKLLLALSICLKKTYLMANKNEKKYIPLLTKRALETG